LYSLTAGKGTWEKQDETQSTNDIANGDITVIVIPQKNPLP
jgi:hypothetical protein